MVVVVVVVVGRGGGIEGWAGRMKDHPHLRGAAASYNSLKEAFLPDLHLSRRMGPIAGA